MQKKLLDMIREVMNNTQQVIRCEDQLKLALAWELKKEYEDKANIYLEYAAKNNTNGRRLYYDIVIEVGNEYIPIELKFKTKFVKGHEYTNQAAQNLGRYDFWTDVERIQNFNENTGKEFTKGYAILVTNDAVYSTYDGEGFYYRNFSTKHKREIQAGTSLVWTEDYNPEAVGKNRNKAIKIKNNYLLNWEDLKCLTDKIKFEALILEINHK